MQILQPYFQAGDERGALRGIVDHGPWQELNFIESRAGVVRGGHYHRDTRELFFIIDGEIEVEIHRLTGERTASVTLRGGDICIVEPLEVHTFRCRTACRWINALSQRMDPASPDIHRVGGGG